MPCFRQSEKVEPGLGGTSVSVYPGKAFLRFIVEWANEHGKMPDKVYAQYLENPVNFRLLVAFRNYKAAREQEEIDKKKGKH